MYTFLKTTIPLALVCSVLVGYTYLDAQWVGPTATPPNGNVPAPINVGGETQDKVGVLGVDGLGVFGNAVVDGGDFTYQFTNTSASARTAWRLRANDGTGNFLSYINSTGGIGATLETDGYGFKTVFNPSNGQYNFKSSGAASQAAGTVTAWPDVLRLFPDGRVGVQQLCDELGNNCTDVSTGGGGSGGPQLQHGFHLNDGSADPYITFPTPFTAIPTVVLNRNYTPGGDDSSNYACNITTTGFNVCGDAREWSGAGRGHAWIAVGN